MVGGAYGTYGAEQKWVLGFDVEIEWDYLEYIGVDGRIILKYILNKCCGMAWTGFIWPRIGASGGNMWTQFPSNEGSLLRGVRQESCVRIIINRAINILNIKCTSWYNTHGRHKLIHVPAPSFHLQGIIRTKVYKFQVQMYVLCALVSIFNTLDC